MSDAHWTLQHPEIVLMTCGVVAGTVLGASAGGLVGAVLGGLTGAVTTGVLAVRGPRDASTYGPHH